MKHRGVLFVVMLLLAAATVVVPLMLTGVPLAVRLVAGITNALAATALAALLWQRRRGP